MSVTYLSTGGVILDDIVFPDGRTAMNFLGGGGVYTAAGMRLWSDQVGLWGRVGPDFDLELLSPLALTENLLQVNEQPTPRAWQLYEEDGTRTQIPRIPEAIWRAQLEPAIADLPDLSGVRGIHLTVRGHGDEPEVLAWLADQGLTVSLEPIVDAETPGRRRDIILACLGHTDIFSPGLSDAYGLLGHQPVRDLLTALADRGPRLVLLRQGAAGSTVYDRQADRFWQVPAAPAQVVDVTGGGNAYCGGFLVGWLEHGQVEQAAARAAVSAAITLEQVGPPAINPARLAEAEQRLAACLPQIKS